MAANFRLFAADHATIVDRLVRCASHSLILYLVVVGVVSEELEPSVYTNYDRLEPEVDVWTLSKRDINACRTCTTRNYVNCCNYYGLCCHILERCPAISVIICSQRCNGGCLNGQWCCPTRTRFPCCTDPLQTTAANDGEQGGHVGSPVQPSVPDSNPATAPAASEATTLASAEATIGTVAVTQSTSGATVAVTSVSPTVVTPESTVSATTAASPSAAISDATQVSTVATITTPSPSSVGTTLASGATAISAQSTTDEGEIENVPDTDIVVLPTRRPTVGVRGDGGEDASPPPVVMVLVKSSTTSTDTSLDMDTYQQHEKEYFP